MNIPFLERLGLTQDADERAIRRAYARELKQIDQEADPEGFQSLREAYEYAMAWARHKAEAAQQPANSRAAPAPADASAPTPRPAPAPAPVPMSASAPVAAPPPIPVPDEDYGTLAQAVYADFRQRSASIPSERPALPEAPWIRELHHSLNDPRLIAIPARDIFEHYVAHQLAEGWQPGHEALLVAAGKVFDWHNDRRRVLRLGRMGDMLDTAIRERDTYDTQPPGLRSEQRHLIERLRDSKPPSTRELVIKMPLLELLIARFPNWLALITSVPNIRQWRQLNEEMPAWRRKLTFTGIVSSKTTSYEKQQRKSGGWNYGWMVFAVIMILGRIGSHLGSSAPPSSTSDRGGSYYLNEGMRKLNANQAQLAVADFSQAVGKNPNDAKARAYRAVALITAGFVDNAEKDLDNAQQLDASEPMIYQGRGMLAKKRKRYDEAIAAFSKSLQLNAHQFYPLMQRAQTYLQIGDYKNALADTDTLLLQGDSDDSAVHMLRAYIQQKQGNDDGAVKEMERAIAAKPKESQVYASAVTMYLELHKRDLALEVLNRGIAEAPDANLYMQRAKLSMPSNIGAMRNDIDSALMLKPAWVDAIRLRAELEFNNRRWKDAIAWLDKSLGEPHLTNNARVELTTMRGIMYKKRGLDAQGDSDFSTARNTAKTPAELALMCRMLANNNLDLKTALELCESALERDSRNAYTLDSKGMALLRLGRYKDAIGAYDISLRYGDLASSWFGRAIAKQHVGDIGGSKTDAIRARKTDAAVEADYASLGLKLSQA